MDNYEEKYKAALGWIGGLYKGLHGKTKEEAEKFFPELKENEDEKIRKELIGFVKTRLVGFPQCDKYLAWIEKQGEQTPCSWKPTEEQFEALDYAYNSCSDTERGNYYEGVLETLIDDLHRLEKQGVEYNLTPKVAFHEGDWVVFNNKHQSIYQVEKIEDGYYILRHTHGGTFRVCVLHDESLRRWTIQDAKDGDVISVTMYPKGTWIGIFKERNGCTFSSYCFVNTEGIFKRGTYNHGNGTAIHPATKEQRDLLFAKMKEAEYEWDEIKKELKKIEQKPVTMSLDKAIEHCKEKSCGNNACALEHKQLGKWLTELKELKEQNPAWSEEDEKMFNKIFDELTPYGECPDYPSTEEQEYYYTRQEMIDWLKSLKEYAIISRTWKPTEEQLKALNIAINVGIDPSSWEGDALRSLQEQLKKL